MPKKKKEEDQLPLWNGRIIQGDEQVDLCTSSPNEVKDSRF